MLIHTSLESGPSFGKNYVCISSCRLLIGYPPKVKGSFWKRCNLCINGPWKNLGGWLIFLFLVLKWLKLFKISTNKQNFHMSGQTSKLFYLFFFKYGCFGWINHHSPSNFGYFGEFSWCFVGFYFTFIYSDSEKCQLSTFAAISFKKVYF